MLTKQHIKVQKKWLTGHINLVATARRLGYKKASLTKGVEKVKTLLGEMGIAVL